ncbi:MAG: hypothetical protein IGS48_07075 [Oscillatoriales cyanobacterium C42_A2020_001]|nr:hypothetical protein [Leptolyngbyaceae cyanobacterium C42_A2020_001]
MVVNSQFPSLSSFPSSPPHPLLHWLAGIAPTVPLSRMMIERYSSGENQVWTCQNSCNG